jgi:hypothetical protein
VPRLRFRFEFLKIPSPSRFISCSRPQGICRYDCVKAGESWPWIRPQRHVWEDFPVFSLVIRESSRETSSPPTPPTAVESACAETHPSKTGVAREVHAIPRGSGRGALGNQSGDPRVAGVTAPRRLNISAADSGGSDCGSGERPCVPLSARLEDFGRRTGFENTQPMMPRSETGFHITAQRWYC